MRVGRVFFILFLFSGVSPGQPLEIDRAAALNRISVTVTGDGQSSQRVQLVIKNLSKTPLVLHVPRYTVLDHKEKQDLLLLDDRQVSLPAGGSARATCSAMCCGQRGETPPDSQPVFYQPTPCSAHPGGQQASRCFETALRLSRAGQLGELPILPSQQPAIVGQLAYWRGQGQLQQQQLKNLVGKSLTVTSPQGQAELDKGVEAVWTAVELTVKELPR